MVRLLALALLVWTACPLRVGAQADVAADVPVGVDAVVLVDGASEASRRRWRRRVEASLDSQQTTLSDWALAEDPVGSVPRARLEVLTLIESLLGRARQEAALLHERDALLVLASAESLASRHLDVPGMSTWYAEIQLAIAILAAQAGQEGLSAAALARAASIDPSRGIHAAEARPDVVERGREAVRRVVTGPRGRFAVRADAPGAEVSLDDRPLGRLPRVVDAPAGPHVLVVDAPGHRRYARVITVFEGERPPLEVRLSPGPELSRARALEAAARSGDVAAVEATMATLGARAPTLALLFAGGGPLDRAVLVTCRPRGCDAPRRLEGEMLDEMLEGEMLDGVAAVSGGLASARRWAAASEAPSVTPEPDWWERWYVWTSVGAVLAAAGLVVGLVAAQPQGPPRLILEVDPGELPAPEVD